MQRKDIFCVKQNINIMFAFTTGQGRHETTLIGGGGGGGVVKTLV